LHSDQRYAPAWIARWHRIRLSGKDGSGQQNGNLAMMRAEKRGLADVTSRRNTGRNEVDPKPVRPTCGASVTSQRCRGRDHRSRKGSNEAARRITGTAERTRSGAITLYTARRLIRPASTLKPTPLRSSFNAPVHKSAERQDLRSTSAQRQLLITWGLREAKERRFSCWYLNQFRRAGRVVCSTHRFRADARKCPEAGSSVSFLERRTLRWCCASCQTLNIAGMPPPFPTRGSTRQRSLADFGPQHVSAPMMVRALRSFGNL